MKMFKKECEHFYAVLVHKTSVPVTIKELRGIYYAIVAHILPFTETVFSNPYLTIKIKGCNDVIFSGPEGTTTANIEDVISELDLIFSGKLERE